MAAKLDGFFQRSGGYEGSEHYFTSALAARGITPEQQDTKMRNLVALGPIVIKPVTHDRYTVAGHEGFYNPYTDTWESANDLLKG